MANLTDPLANPVHGTNPQNLIEYITRQKIYSSTFWKEECFGLNAQDIAAKAALRVKCIGGSYGGNSKPSRFLCLVLKMLQIGVDESIVEEFLQNEDFKYVRLLGMFYLRLTGRPADIYEKLEPFYSDYRKVRHRLSSGWEIIYVDEYVHTLLTKHEMCGISFPRLPKRQHLQEAGYLDDEMRRTALGDGIDEDKAYEMLVQLANDGNLEAKNAIEKRQERKKKINESIVLRKPNLSIRESTYKQSESQNLDHSNTSSSHKSRNRSRSRDKSRSRSRSRSWGRNESNSSKKTSHPRDTSTFDDYYHSRKNDQSQSNRGYSISQSNSSRMPGNRNSSNQYRHEYESRSRHERENRGHSDRRNYSRESSRRDASYDDDYRKSRRGHRDKESRKKEPNYGNLFKKKERKKTSNSEKREKNNREQTSENGQSQEIKEGTIEFWNEERAKLGLKPLKE